jgi:hypothetical protein
MNNLKSLVRKTAMGLTVVAATVACATGRSDSTAGSPTLPRDVVAAVAKYANVDPANIAVITAVDFQGNVRLLTPEGITVQPTQEPQRASLIEKVDSVGVVAFKVNPVCVWITIAGGRYLYCK